MFAMLLRCDCDALAMYSYACDVLAMCLHGYNALAVRLRCACDALAMRFNVIAMRLPCDCDVLATRLQYALRCACDVLAMRLCMRRHRSIGAQGEQPIGKALQVMVKPLPQAACISHESNRRRIPSCAASVSATYAHISASSQPCIESCGTAVTATYANQARIEVSDVCNLWSDRHRNMCASGAHRNSAAL